MLIELRMRIARWLRRKLMLLILGIPMEQLLQKVFWQVRLVFRCWRTRLDISAELGHQLIKSLARHFVPVVPLIETEFGLVIILLPLDLIHDFELV